MGSCVQPLTCDKVKREALSKVGKLFAATFESRHPRTGASLFSVFRHAEGQLVFLLWEKTSVAEPDYEARCVAELLAKSSAPKGCGCSEASPGVQRKCCWHSPQGRLFRPTTATPHAPKSTEIGHLARERCFRGIRVCGQGSKASRPGRPAPGRDRAAPASRSSARPSAGGRRSAAARSKGSDPEHRKSSGRAWGKCVATTAI